MVLEKGGNKKLKLMDWDHLLGYFYLFVGADKICGPSGWTDSVLLLTSRIDSFQ